MVGVGLVARADARNVRVAQIPNGAVNGCATCHMSASGGDARNAFGKMVGQQFLTAGDFTGRVIWGPELAQLDADGDGFTNGEELGDPDGVWSRGSTSPGDPASVTSPADPASHPPIPEPTAVEATSWGKVKRLVQDLLN
jgi:dopamine beta-monooxygenase